MGGCKSCENTMALEGWVLVVIFREERELTMTEVNSHNLLFSEFVHQQTNKNKLRGLSLHANYTDRAAAAGRRS